MASGYKSIDDNSASRLDIDELILKILSCGHPEKSMTKTVKEQDLMTLCHLAKKSFLDQPVMVEVEAPIKVCGDVHGQYSDVIRLFGIARFPPHSNYLFLGDYVDRGRQNLELITLFLCYKIKFYDRFYLLRGNHECPAVNRVYGFYEECNKRYASTRLWLAFQEAFAAMPFTGLISGRILCMHGGLSPKLTSLDVLRDLTRPMDPPSPSLHIDLLWSDPDMSVSDWAPNVRGVSYIFGPNVVKQQIETLGIDLIARAHQVVQDGYEFFAEKKLVTIFSAPHYCGQFDNSAAIMSVDEGLTCSFHTLIPFILMYCPVGLLYVFPFFKIEVRWLVSIPALSCCIYPSIEPLIVIFCIKGFRIIVVCKKAPIVAHSTTQTTEAVNVVVGSKVTEASKVFVLAS